MIDLLIHTSDTVYCDPLLKRYDIDIDRASNMKHGYLQRVASTGKKWGRLELDRKRFLILRCEDHLFNPRWLEPEFDLDGKETSDRLFRFPLQKILTLGEYEALLNIPYNEKEIREPIIKVVDDLKTIVAINSIEDLQVAPIKLHGSAGNFDVEEDGGGDYTSLKTAVETEAADISGGAVDANFYIKGAWDSTDTPAWDIDGWTMGTNNMLIQTSGDARNSNPVYNDGGTRYRIENGTGEMFDIETENVTIDGINGVGYIITSGSADDWKICNTILDSTAANSIVAYVGNGTVEGCILEGAGDKGILYAAPGTCNFNNNTVVNKVEEGARCNNAGATFNANNCAMFNNLADFYNQAGTLNINACATEEGAGEGTDGVAITQTASNYAALVEDFSNGDYTPVGTSSELYDSASASNRPSTDITGYTWVTDDAGAIAYQTGGSPSTILPNNLLLLRRRELHKGAFL